MKKIQSVERAVAVLELLDSLEGNTGLGVNEVARLLKLKPPTVHNFLQTLAELGYLEQNEHCKYRLAERTQWLGWEGKRKELLIAAARPHAARLSLDLNETVILTAQSGFYWQTLLRFESNHGLMVRDNLPVNTNFYISATGRCILSQLPARELERLIAHFRLPLPSEWAGAETLEGMLAALEKIRYDRYELIHTDNGVSGAGAVITPFRNAAVGALGVYLPTFRFKGEHRKKILDGLRTAAARIRP